MKVSGFRMLLIMACLMCVGAVLLPRIELTGQPRGEQGHHLVVSYVWPGASSHVVEQNVTSRVEGLASSVKGVESTESESRFGSGSVKIAVKKGVSVSAVKFEIQSLIRQTYKRLPQGVSYPVVTGGEVVTDAERNEAVKLLTYYVHGNIDDHALQTTVQRQAEKTLRDVEGVAKVEVTGAPGKYILVSYKASDLANAGLTSQHLEAAVRKYIGREDVVGTANVTRNGVEERMALYLTTNGTHKPIGNMPVGEKEGKIIYLNELATYEYLDKLPESYYRVNGMRTVYLNIYAVPAVNRIALAKTVRQRLDRFSGQMTDRMCMTLQHDATAEMARGLNQVVAQTWTALMLLLFVVWAVARDWRYMVVIGISLMADILLAAIFYWLLHLQFNIFSLAGITVSFGMVVDATIVMADHYSYHRNRHAFFAVLAALLTTIGSMVVVAWLPEQVRDALYDFSLIVMVNLTVALFVAYFFSPALIDAFQYASGSRQVNGRKRMAVRWTQAYRGYICFAQRYKWCLIVLLVWAFGIPFHALPDYADKEEQQEQLPWYERCYAATLGSRWFQDTLKEPLSKYLGGSIRLFAETLANQEVKEEEKKPVLHIMGRIPLGGSVHQLNEKVVLLESFLSKQEGIRQFESRVSKGGAFIEVEFEDSVADTSLPFMVESKVIGRMITIGGADWSTYGVSERGFSNAVNLQHRFQHIDVRGYDYNRLLRIAEFLAKELEGHARITDVSIETPGITNLEDEFYMSYHRQRMALYGFGVSDAYLALKDKVAGRELQRTSHEHRSVPVYLKPVEQDSFDVWHLSHAQVNIGNRSLFLSDLMDMHKRKAKSVIQKRHQEYVIRVAFNIQGSFNYISRFLKETVVKANSRMPIGFKCENQQISTRQQWKQSYAYLLIVVLIIFWICAILFNSLRMPLAILSLVPVSYIGIFLIYHVTDLTFGRGGYAALMLLCGLTVNSGIYVLAAFRDNARCCSVRRLSGIEQYLKAFNQKFSAISLTLLSTILGLVPFLFSQSNDFWFSFAVGVMGGLVTSLVAIIFVVPVFLNLQERTHRCNLASISWR